MSADHKHHYVLSKGLKGQIHLVWLCKVCPSVYFMGRKLFRLKTLGHF